MIPPRQISAFADEMSKIAGGGIMKALATDVLPKGQGGVVRRLGRGLRNAGGELKNQVQRYGIKGLF